jgi:hypothetical protein
MPKIERQIKAKQPKGFKQALRVRNSVLLSVTGLQGQIWSYVAVKHLL